MRRRRILREDEQALWSSFVRDITPLARKSPRPPSEGGAGTAPVPAPAPTTDPDRPSARPPVQPSTQPSTPSPAAAMPGPRVPGHTLVRTQAEIEIGRRRPGLDDTSWRALVSGKLRPARTLDLHGQNVQAAFSRLHAFLIQARADNLRCVEVITGLGSGQRGGVLRRELPFWLGRPDLRPLILAVTHPHAANQGSVRILLRRAAHRKS
ncbi:Smr/MutS family protein [Nguyenibacter sp. L1]|uniref:Smr/MutS family protein n=1 Tax=Nguyenibacter sp. L1 TaxID=3049350 RepID=UPI00309219B6|nr:Smr/MutS family protein [Nguyenibacter sp. L1]